MNYDLRFTIYALVFLFSLPFAPQLRGQGALTPPGAPAPTMKSLDQIEARTPISSAPFSITQPGSYYLTTNVTVSGGNAITIATNGVTLDLNGFTIFSTDASATGYGILINSGLENITIANGFIQGGVTNNGSGAYGGSGFGYGIDFSGIQPVNVLVSRVSVSGCQYYGIDLNNGDSTVVESCSVRTVGNYGIIASTIKQSLAIDCGVLGIGGDEVSDSRGESGGSDYGVSANYLARDCYGFSSSGYGVAAATARDCYGYSISGDGVVANTAENCFGNSSGGGYGVYTYDIANGCFGYSNSGTGLYGFIANVCHGGTGTGTGLITSHNVNSF